MIHFFLNSWYNGFPVIATQLLLQNEIWVESS